MNTCKTCKHWTPPERYETSRFLADGKTIEKAIARHGAGCCSKLQYYDKFPFWIEGETEPPIDLTKAGAAAADDHGITFYCGSDFGCIHHAEGVR